MQALPHRPDAGLTRRTAAWGLVGIPAAGLALATCTSSHADPYRKLAGDGAWLNGPPLGPAELRGKVVLVNFWTYTCINSLRPLPYVRAWADKYRDRGLVVIGVHAPEFSFEHELPRVRRAVSELGVRYPVVLDNDQRIWRAFGNSAWPGFYILDAKGQMRHTRLGEGEYDRSEHVIQDLLGEARGERIADPIVPVAGIGPEAAPDWDDLGTGETYAGYAKAENFVSTGRRHRDAASRYEAPKLLPPNSWALSGVWNVGAESAAVAEPGGRIVFRFHARDLHLVMAPGADERPTTFRVRIDGAEPGPDHGFDITPDGRGELRDARMYQLVRQAGPVRDRTFEIEFPGAGPRAYCFTFG